MQPTATSMTRKKADCAALACVMVGRSSTITAVKGAAAKRELELASNDRGAIAIAKVTAISRLVPCGMIMPTMPL